jgi:sugar phosphate isomerase/epimerase
MSGPYFINIKPSLVRRRIDPSETMHLGMHCRGRRDIEYIKQARAPLTVIEVKPEKFRGPEKLFYQKKGEFHLDRQNFERLVREAKQLGLTIQFHFPDKLGRTALNPGIVEHHHRIVSLFRSIAEAVEEYDLLPNVTFHPPTLMWNRERQLPDGNIQEALEITNQLFAKLALEHASQNWPILLGIENQMDPKKDSHVLGYAIEHFQAIMADAPDWINLTIDFGHRILSQDLSVSKLLAFAKSREKRVINMHFHENQGEQTDSYKDDQHSLPLGKQIHGYLHALNRAVQDRVPLILEVNTRHHNPIEFLVASSGIRKLMDEIEKERLERES